MKYLCEGYVYEVKKLLENAPRGNPRFKNCEEFYFAMFSSNVERSKESRLVSPIAVAVCVGDPSLLESLINCNHKPK